MNLHPILAALQAGVGTWSEAQQQKKQDALQQAMIEEERRREAQKMAMQQERLDIARRQAEHEMHPDRQAERLERIRLNQQPRAPTPPDRGEMLLNEGRQERLSSDRAAQAMSTMAQEFRNQPGGPPPDAPNVLARKAIQALRMRDQDGRYRSIPDDVLADAFIEAWTSSAPRGGTSAIEAMLLGQ